MENLWKSSPYQTPTSINRTYKYKEEGGYNIAIRPWKRDYKTSVGGLAGVSHSNKEVNKSIKSNWLSDRMTFFSLERDFFLVRTRFFSRSNEKISRSNEIVFSFERDNFSFERDNFLVKTR